MQQLNTWFYGIVSLSLIACQVMAAEGTKLAPKLDEFPKEVRIFVEQLTKDNNKHIENISKEKLKTYVEDQSPRATVVSCSDSRVQSDAFHKNPINDLFFIRNIGNQIQSSEGSVEYGVNHLKTPILLIMGHSQCGAVHAAMGDYSKLSKSIKGELDNLDLLKGNDTDEGVIANIHNQVNYAMNKFKDKIQNKELTVIGLIYDFRNDFGHDHGKMIVIDVNGETDAERLKALPLLQGIKDIAIGDKRAEPAPKPAGKDKAAEPASTDATISEKANPNAKKMNFKFNLDAIKQKFNL